MRLFFSILIMMMLCVPASAESPAFKAGVNYFELAQPKKYQDSDKIEVLMFLWYGCSGCFKLDSKITGWAEKFSDDVIFTRLPAMFFPEWELHGRVYLTMEKLGASFEKHHAAFTLLQKDKFKLQSEKDLPAFIEKMAVDKDAFMKYFNSIELTEQVENLQAMAYDYGLNAVPAMVINGRYRYSVKETDGSRFLELADHLINMERNSKQQ